MSGDFTVLTQEDINMLRGRRALDAKFEQFMEEATNENRETTARLDRLEVAVAGSTASMGDVHIALFAKDDQNKFEIAGLMTNMQRVVKHTEVVCNIARFFKWLVIGCLSLVVPVLAGLHYLGVIG